MSNSQARGQVLLAKQLDLLYPVLQEAWEAGRLSEGQTRAVVRGLKRLPVRLSAGESARVQRELVDFAQDYDPPELEQLASRYHEILDPDAAEATDRAKAEADAADAFRRRELHLAPDHHGSFIVSGRIPVATGQRLLAHLTAAMPSRKSYTTAGLPVPAAAARRADALARLLDVADTAPRVPTRFGERPTIYVTMTPEDVTSRRGRAVLMDSGEALSPAEARVLACDAAFARLVLGPSGEVLELGESKRLFKGGLRRALVARDKGCAFPGCDTPAMLCDGHHIIPWQHGGPTNLDNAVLVCPFHHRMVEPDPGLAPQYQWHIHLDPATRLPLFTPPTTMRGDRAPRQHHRYRLTRTTLTKPSGRGDPTVINWPVEGRSGGGGSGGDPYGGVLAADSPLRNTTLTHAELFNGPSSPAWQTDPPPEPDGPAPPAPAPAPRRQLDWEPPPDDDPWAQPTPDTS